MAVRWVAELPKANGAWTVSPDEIAEVARLADAAQAAVDHRIAGGAVDFARLRETFAALARYMRFLHGRKFFSPPMEDSDYMRLGLKPPDRVRTGHFTVTELVEYDLALRGLREIVVRFWIKGAGHRAKPTGFDGAVLAWDVRDTPPATPADLTRHALASRTPYIVTFDETARGKTVYFALAWQNGRGKRGPWSDIQSAIVP
jgi:hypothetical protein